MDITIFGLKLRSQKGGKQSLENCHNYSHCIGLKMQSRDLFSLLLTDVVIGLLLNVTHYMPFILPDLPHRTDYSLSEGDQKNYTLLLKISFPKGYQEIKKSINQLFMSIRGMGLCRSSEPKAHV